MIELAGAAGIGVALGIVTGLPLGLVNVAIVEAGHAGDRRQATRIGLGGALADAVHAAIAFVGVGRALTERPEWKVALALVTVAAVATYATSVWRRRHRRTPQRRGVLVGLALTLPNPGALAAWVAVAAVLWPAITVPAALVLAVGVGVGSALWFSALAWWASRARTKPPPRSG